MTKTRTLLIATTAAALACGTSAAMALEGVVTSIKPIHSLVAGVMEGVAEPELIVTGSASPHTYSMRPSDAAKLQAAPLVFWVGPGLEAFLADPLATLGADATVVALEETDGLTRLEYREGGAFESHGHAEAEHGAQTEDDHAHEGEHAQAEHDHEHDHEGHADHGHDHGGFDTHYWLDPENAKAMVSVIAAELSEADPANAGAYEANATDLTERLDALAAEVANQVAPVADRPFIVFHDAYHYFEDRFGLEAAGAITINPETPPSAARIAQLQARIAELGAVCVFSEPQFDPAIVDALTDGSDARAGVLDPEGAALADGPDLYFELIRAMGTSFADCLGGQS